MKIYFNILAWIWCATLLAPTASWAQTPVAPKDEFDNLVAFASYFNVMVNESELRKNSSLENWPQLVNTMRVANLPFDARQLSLHELQKKQEIVLLHLLAPEQFVIAQAIDVQRTLLRENGRDRLIENTELNKRYSGEALLWSRSQNARWQISNPVRVLNIDTIGGASELTETIALHNTGDKPLRIEVASTSCGCTGASVSPEVIAPGASGVLTAKMHTSSNRLVTVNLRADDPQRPYTVIALQSQVPEGIGPPSTLLISAEKGRAVTASTIIRLPLGVKAVKATARQTWLKAALVAVTSSDTKSSAYRVEVSLGADAPTGRLQEEVTLQLQGSTARLLVVPVDGFVSDDITVEPSLLMLGEVPRGSHSRKIVIVRGPADKPFSIRSIKGSNAHLSGKASPDIVASSHAVEIGVEVDGEIGAGLQERVTLALSDGRVLDVDVIGKITAPDEAVKAPASLNVGEVAPGFAAIDTNGVIRRPADLRGKKNVLLTFFPKCFTGGCAGQMASLQAELPGFDAADTQILAVSVDPAAEQTAFAAKLGLQFPLLPDTTRQLSMLYGAAQTPTDLAARQSVLIDKSGVVRWIDTDVHVQTHGADVLSKMRELKMIP